MLEDRKNLTELDDDFITLWSNYIIYQDKDVILPFLEILAEGGQINAIQSWYLLKNPEAKNDKIDKIVDTFDLSSNFNKIWAMANRAYDKNREQISYLEETLSTLHKKDVKENDAFSHRRKNELLQVLASTSYAKYSKDALKKGLSVLDTTKSPLVAERCLEMCSTFPNYIYYQFDEKMMKQLKTLLLEAHKNFPDDPAIAFALAKILHFFGNNNSKLKIPKDNQMAIDLLYELSERELHTFVSEQQETNSETQNRTTNTETLNQIKESQPE